MYNSPYSSFWGSDTFNKKMIYVSPGTELVYGHHPEEFLSNPNLWFEVILAEDRHIVERAYPDMQAGKIVELEYRINHSKRGIVWVEARMLPTIDSQGRFVRLDGVTVDITSRKQVELNLQEHEKNLKEAQRIASIGSWQLDHVTGKMKLSEEIERIFEFNTNEIEPNFPHFISFIHPEDVQMVVEGFEKSIKEKTSFDLMYRIQLPDTRVKYMQSRGETVFDIDGRPMQSIGTTQDMTILRMAEMALADREARLETIYQNGPDSIKLTNRNNELLEMNPAGLKMIEADSLEQVQGKSLLEIVNEPFKKRYAEVTEEIYSGKTAIFQYQVTTLKGNLRWFESHSVPMRDTNGKIIAMLCVTHDITEKKQADENLRISNAEFRQLAAHIEKIREEERMNLSREIHDELGQKLTALKMDAKWIGKRMSAADKEVEERFNSFSQMLDSMVKNVRKIASELRPSELEHLGLQPTLELYAQDFERRTGMKVSFQADISAFTSTPEISISLFRIFQESLTNIARHSGATEVNILVSIEEGDNFIMKIHDNGIGYNETQVKTRKTLGLLGMRERARLHGGDYLIRSIPGFGTQIEVSIPLGKSGAVVQSETT
ncbi:MAG: PAS domain-containing protein [Bacteroidia bacterium]